MKTLEFVLEYIKKDLRHDLTAAVTVMLLAIPQATAYALLAGLPVSAGLLSAITAAGILGVFGSSRHLIIGPTNAIALLIQAGTSAVLEDNYGELDESTRQAVALQLVMVISLLAGSIQIIIAGFGLGRLTQFVSSPVMVGYIAAVACALVVNQLFPLLGVPALHGDYSVVEKGAHLVQHLPSIHWPTAALGVAAIVLLQFLRWIYPKHPHALFMIAVISALGLLLPVSLHCVGDPGAVVARWVMPELSLPLIIDLLPVAVAIAILGVLEATSVSRTVAASSQQLVRPNRDVFGLGLANLYQCLIGGMPASGSPSRSVLNFRTGGRTGMAAVWSGLMILLVVSVASPLLSYVPKTALAAMLIVTAFTGMVDRSQLMLCLTATRTDTTVLVLTFLSACLFSLDKALYVGMFLSSVLSLNKMRAMPNMESVLPPSSADGRQVRVLDVPGHLLMGGADHLPELLGCIAKEKETRVIVLRMQKADYVDASVCLAFRQAHERVRDVGCHLLGCAVNSSVCHVFRKSGIADEWGEKNIFSTDKEAEEESVQRCMDYAERLLKEQDRT